MELDEARLLRSPEAQRLLAALPPYRGTEALALAELLRREGNDRHLVAVVLSQARLRAAAEERLTAEVGPVARVLVRREARRHASRSALVEALAAHVPDEPGRGRFREALSRLGV